MPRDQRTITAYHEAGHAVLAWAVGLRVEEVSIERIGDSRGRVIYARAGSGVDDVVRAVLIGGGGMAADGIHWDGDAQSGPDEMSEGGESDRRRMMAQLEAIGLGFPLAVEVFMARAHSELRASDRWAHVVAVSDLLLGNDVLEPSDIARFSLAVRKVDDSVIKDLVQFVTRLQEVGITTAAKMEAYASRVEAEIRLRERLSE